MAGFDKNRGVIVVCLLLALSTLFLYRPATRNGFVNLDDNEYIVDNPHVTPGLTLNNVEWAFGSGYASNWHPLTWVSHMLDCQLYGLNPGGHHLSSVLLHIADSVLVLLLFRQMTGSLWRSAFLAALFAWHPLHVESVAWASERKDVLSTLFWLLTMLAYVSYTRSSAAKQPACRTYYCLSLFFFVLGLMSKAMLVTLPFALLLLDFWPLKRTICLTGFKEQPSPSQLPWSRLILEKLPFFLLALAGSMVTYLVQQRGGAVSSLEEASVSRRLSNAAVSYLRYVSKAIWPVNLAALYPYPRHQSVLLVLLSVTFLLFFSSLFILAAKRRPYLFTGWFWFLGTLVPTIGLVQVGSQAMADRYMYIPSIGLFALVVWGLPDFLNAWTSAGNLMAAAVGIIALAGCLVCTSLQVRTWHDSEQLYRHAIGATEKNYIAYNGLGGALDAENRPDDALTYYFKSVEINPRYPEGQYNLGTALLNRGRLDDAVTHLNLALKQNPDYVVAHNNLGVALMKAGRTTDSVTQFAQAVRLDPDYFEAYGNLGIALMKLGRVAEAITQFARAVRLKPDDPSARSNLGIALMDANRPAEAAIQFSAALRLDSGDPNAEFNLAEAFALERRTRDAVAHYRAAIGLKPDFTEALNRLAWILATDPNPDLRDGAEAVKLAAKACEITHFQQAGSVLTLSAADAASGQFSDASAMARKARDLATAAGDKDAEARAGALLKLFDAGQPFRDSN
jgi:tetratricopeptide (TPR) repeat protein